MNYEKKLALAKEALDSGSYDKETIEYIFPELVESEDERIRKTLIDYFNICHGDYYGELKRKDILAWLEKQGEQKPILDFNADDWYVSKVDGKIHNIYHSVDKIEPKFKVGEWIVWKDKCYKVNYNNCGYELVDQDGLSTSLEYGTIDENAHLWDVTTDAKDGDVLNSPSHHLIWIYKDIQHYHVCVNMNYVKENFSTDGFIVIPTDVCPATKDEQTILFARMKEAGYEWDSEKKVLKKIEKKSIDKVKPKFKVGDWITDGYLYNKITDVLEDRYIVDTKFAKRSSIPFKSENYYHLWTIQDAKDGDVLISKYGKPFIYNGNLDSFHIGSYCGITTEGMFNVAAEKCYWTGNVNIYPSTKGQRDLLFQKMREASYEWDAEKKELKKINSYCQENCKGFQEIGKCFTDGECKVKREAEQKPTDEEMKTLLRTEYEKGRADAIAEIQKPVDCIDCTNSKGCINCEDGNMKETLVQKTAWSEEDESYLNTTIAYLKDAKEFKKSAENCINWLKSLKDRVQPRRRHTIFDEII